MTLSNTERTALVSYRLERAEQTLIEMKAVAALGFWNLAANRLYYAAYYASVALLINEKIEASTHKGSIRMIGLKFIKEGILKTEDAQLLGRLFSMRQTGDYDDMFDWTAEDVEPLIPKVEDYVRRIKDIIDL